MYIKNKKDTFRKRFILSIWKELYYDTYLQARGISLLGMPAWYWLNSQTFFYSDMWQKMYRLKD